MDLDAFYCKTTFYVRPQRTLVVGTVGRRVGGPGSVMWRSGWALGLSAGSLADVAPSACMDALMGEFLRRNDVRPLSTDAQQAWMRTWRNTG
jgi:hypothetical protein